MTLTGLPGGKVKLELGVDVLDLTPCEKCHLATMARGWAINSNVIEGEREGRNDRARLERIEDLLGTTARRMVQIEQAAQDALNAGSLFAAA